MTIASLKIFSPNWTFLLRTTPTTTQEWTIKDVVSLRIDEGLLERDIFTIKRALGSLLVSTAKRLVMDTETGLPKIIRIEWVRELGESTQIEQEVRLRIETTRDKW